MTTYPASYKRKVEVEIEQRKRKREREEQARQSLTPAAWAAANATIVHPRLGRIPFSPYSYQVDFLNNYAVPRRLVLKARQIGFSQVFALEALYAALTEPETTILLVSRSQDLAVNLLRYCYLSYNNLRDAPPFTKANESEMAFGNGSRIKSIPANRSTGRGFAASRVYLDEFAYADYAEDIYQSVSPTVSQGGSITIGSTPNGSGNLFHALYLTGADFTRQTVPWYHCPAYYTADEKARGVPYEEAAWYVNERPKYNTRQWKAEYECAFEGSGQGALWSSGMIDSYRVHRAPQLARIVVGVDPSATASGDEAGIVVVGIDAAKHCYVLDDLSIQGTPDAWARQAVVAYHRHKADKLIAESNQGGEMVTLTLRSVDASVPVTLVHASRGKYARAEPIAALYEQGRVHHVGLFRNLEDELCSWVPGGPSPNRLDALVWALSSLTQQGTPQARAI